MTTAHTYELPSGELPAPLSGAVADAERGEIAYLTRNGRPVAALTPIDSDQAWFWTPEWQEGEREVDAWIVGRRARGESVGGAPGEVLTHVRELIDDFNREGEESKGI